MEKTVPIIKMNGIGNKILVIDMRLSTAPLERQIVLRLAANKETEFDQIMTILPPRTKAADAMIDIWNKDGTKARACGNGMRCVVAYLAQGQAGKQFSFETPEPFAPPSETKTALAGKIGARSLGNGQVEVDMSEPAFDWRSIPLTRPLKDTLHVKFEAGRVWDGTLVSMGNPHGIFFVNEDIDQIPLEQIGPILEYDPIFADRANISLARLVSPRQIQLRTWERGAGLTRACGTAACAAVVAAVRRGISERFVNVQLPGGMLQITWDQKTGHVLMAGDTQHEFSGQLDLITGHVEKTR